MLDPVAPTPDGTNVLDAAGVQQAKDIFASLTVLAEGCQAQADAIGRDALCSAEFKKAISFRELGGEYKRLLRGTAMFVAGPCFIRGYVDSNGGFSGKDKTLLYSPGSVWGNDYLGRRQFDQFSYDFKPGAFRCNTIGCPGKVTCTK